MSRASRLSSPAVRWLGVGLVVGALVLAVALVLFGDDGGDGGEEADAGPLPGPVDLDDGWTLTAIGRVPGASALSLDDDEVRAADAQTGARYVADLAAVDPAVEGPTPFDAIPRQERSVPDPDGEHMWAAEGAQLLQLDADGGVVDTVELPFPAAVVAVTDEAVWLTVTGVPVADESGVVAPRSVVQRVDTGSLEVIAVPVDDPVDFRFAVRTGDDGDEVWATVGATLYRLDPLTAEPLAEIALDAAASALVLGDGVVLVVVADPAGAHVLRVDPSESAATGRLALGDGAVGEAALVAGPADELWVLRPDEGAVTRLDLGSEAISSFEVDEPRRIEVDDSGSVWILSGRDDGLLFVARRTDG